MLQSMLPPGFHRGGPSADMMKIKQVNLNHCRQAQNLLLHAVAVEMVDVVIASGPMVSLTGWGVANRYRHR